MVGKKFNKWTVLAVVKKGGRRGDHLLVRCECGYEKVHASYNVVKGFSRQCKECFKKTHKSYLPGEIKGKWTVLKEERNQWAEKSYLCRCECGRERVIRKRDLEHGNSTKCVSCHISLKNTTHNNSKSPTYRIWAGIRQRCKNPKNGSFKWYGGRGIKICERWDEYPNFLQDMGVRPDRYSIDRINPDGDYEPNNCRWVSPEQNQANRRNSKQYEGIYVYVKRDVLCQECVKNIKEPV